MLVPQLLELSCFEVDACSSDLTFIGENIFHRWSPLGGVPLTHDRWFQIGTSGYLILYAK